jgi:hypothetical protein
MELIEAVKRLDSKEDKTKQIHAKCNVYMQA